MCSAWTAFMREFGKNLDGWKIMHVKTAEIFKKKKTFLPGVSQRRAAHFEHYAHPAWLGIIVECGERHVVVMDVLGPHL